VQDAFLRLYLHRDEMPEPGHWVPWLYRTAYNRIIDEHRRSRRSHNLFAALLDRRQFGADLALSDLTPELLDSFRRLPVRQRAAAALFYLADLTVAQSAAAMGISVGSVDVHLNRARRALRKSLEVES
jgi:RNA polymerase sigma-70 factor, ECF subfamily